jgi:integrase
MTPEELGALLQAAPEHRRLAYEVALMTGLRFAELRALQISDLNLEIPALLLRPEWTKNRRPGMQPIPRALADRLKELADSAVVPDLYTKYYKRKNARATHIPTHPLLYIPSHAARDMDKDLMKAGVRKFIVGQGKVDFHSCRVNYISAVVESGATIKEAMSLARHSDPRLTLGTYARASHSRLTGLVEKIADGVPAQPATITEPEPEVARLDSPNESVS